MVRLPVKQYRRDGRIVKGLQRGAHSFARTTASEALKLTSKLSHGASAVLSRASDAIAGGSAHVAGAGEHAPGRPYRVSRYAHPPVDASEAAQAAYRVFAEEMQHALSSAPGLLQTAPRSPSSDASLYDGGEQDIDVDSDGDSIPDAGSEDDSADYDGYEHLPHSRRTISAPSRPEHSLQPASPSSGALPAAILRPVIGATEALSQLLLGLRSVVDPESVERAQDKYASPFMPESTVRSSHARRNRRSSGHERRG
ncbi:hypothetical protein GQ42DRAFT_90637 [Ramicandelaber brevisporus]|nr:hypothetical protein GQ42DRAFT_90637 [Ramicandelaber brevisporus]